MFTISSVISCLVFSPWFSRMWMSLIFWISVHWFHSLLQGPFFSYEHSFQAEIRLGKPKSAGSRNVWRRCTVWCGYTFLDCWASVQDKVWGETAVIWVITRLAWSEKFVLQLADPSWLRQSALYDVSVGLIQRHRPVRWVLLWRFQTGCLPSLGILGLRQD